MSDKKENKVEDSFWDLKGKKNVNTFSGDENAFGGKRFLILEKMNCSKYEAIKRSMIIGNLSKKIEFISEKISEAVRQPSANYFIVGSNFLLNKVEESENGSIDNLDFLDDLYN